MKSLMKLINSSSVALLMVLLICLAISAGFLWQHQMTSEQHQQAMAEKHVQFAQMIQSTIESKVGIYNQRMAAAAKSPQLATVMASQNASLITTQQQALMSLFPLVNQVCLIDASVDEPNPDACIPITFATLNSLRLAKKDGKAPIAVMQSADKSTYLLLAQSIKDSRNKVVGELVITLADEVVQTLLQSTYSADGYIELQQGDNTSDAIASQGDRQWRQGRPLFDQPLANSHWRLAYWPVISHKDNAHLIVLGIILFSVLLLWFLRERAYRFVVQHDLALLKNQLTDIGNSQLKSEYPAMMAGMGDITDEVKRLSLGGLSKSAEQKPQEVKPIAIEDAAETDIKADKNTLEFTLPAGNTDQAESAALEPEMQIAIVPAIFKAYDIRGIVGETIDHNVMRTIGQAIGSEALDKEQSRLVVGRDGRLSSEALSQALVEGILASGCEVVDIGLVPTPLVSFACEHLNTHSGVMVTASHNPANYNGLKITIADKPIFGAKLQQLYQRILLGDVRSGQGSYSQLEIIDDYIAQVISDVTVTQSLKVVVDCGNGVAGVVIPQLLTALGCEVIQLYCDVDGEFPNHHPNPSDPDNLQDLIVAVQRSNADLGFAFDGDGDRLGTVDGDGNIIWSDRLMIMFAQDVLSRLPGSLVIYDVKCSSLLKDAILDAGGEALMWQSGYALIRDKMQETGAPLAGELTGHIFFNDRWYGFDDALYTACRLIELLTRDPLERHSTEIFAAIPNRESTPEIIVEMDENECRRFIQQFVAEASFQDAKISTIDGLRADFSSGWGLVRASNTVPGLILRFEAETQDGLEEIQQQFKQQMLQVKPTITLLF